MRDSKPISAKIREGRTWLLEFRDLDNRMYCTAIPPTNGDRIDFIDRNFKYHYNYKGVISHGFLIEIINGKPKIHTLMDYPVKRIHRYFRDLNKQI